MPLAGSARAPVCGSRIDVSLELSDDGAISRTGQQVQACAIGQASAALFAQGCLAMPASSIAQAEREITLWLDGSGDLPGWPGFAVLEPARGYPARHGAILLPWKAALDALSKGATGR